MSPTLPTTGRPTLLADRPFRGLLATGLGLAALVALSVVLATVVAGEAGRALALCGRWMTVLDPTPSARRWAALGLLAAMLVAAAGALLLTLARTAVALARLRRDRVPPPSEVAALAAELGLSGRLDIVRSDRLFCLCHGLLRPRVCASSGLVETLDPEALRAVLAHERHHLRRRDPARMLAVNVLAALSFPLPLAQGLRRAWLVAREIDADRAAVEAAGRGALARALLALLSAPAPAARGGLATSAAADAPTGLRIAHVLRPAGADRPRLEPRILIVSAAMSLLLGALLLPRPGVPPHAMAAAEHGGHGEHATMPVADLCEAMDGVCGTERCDALCCPAAVLGATCHVEPAARGSGPVGAHGP